MKLILTNTREIVLKSVKVLTAKRLPELPLNSELCCWVTYLAVWVTEQLIFTLVLSVPPQASSTVN